VAQIFLSYSREDAERAKVLAGRLGDHGHNVWWDRNIAGGSKFAAEIEQALNAAEVVIVLWSERSIKSTWVLDEAAEGRDSGRLLPVVLDDCKPPLGFRQFQAIAARHPASEEPVQEIARAIARMTGQEGESYGEVASAIPTGLEAHCMKARHFEDAGKYADAEREIELALQLDPGSWTANREAARLHYIQGRPAEAIGFCEKAMAAMRNDHESASLLISCYRSIEDHAALTHAAEVAAVHAEHSIASGAAMGPAFASGAKALAALGHVDRARKWLRKALNVDPGNLPMRYSIAATLAAFFNDGEAALDLLESFVEQASNRTHLQLLEGDPDWSSMRETPDFQALVARARRRVEAMESTSLA
jgi:tetratricopeptide (TPR) repeat protein